MGDATLVIGVGNRDRGDDGVGPAVAGRVAELADDSLEVTTSTADPSRLMDRWFGHDSVVIVDAVVDGRSPGTITVLDAIDRPLPSDAGSISSHGFGVAAAVELARSLGRLPERLTVIGVSAQHFDGDCLTPSVSQAVAVAATKVLEVARA